MKKAVLITVIVLASAILLNGCMFTANTPNQGAIAQEQKIVVEETKTVEPAQIPGCPNRILSEDWATIFEMESCLEIKHERKDWKNAVYELVHYDSDEISVSIVVNDDKTIINAKIFYKKPCKHAKSYSVNLEFVPPIKNYLNQGRDSNGFRIDINRDLDEKPSGAFNRFESSGWQEYPDPIKEPDGKLIIESDGQNHKIIPTLTCAYETSSPSQISYIKDDIFYGKAVYVK